MGINRTVHFRLGGMAERDRIGRALAPVEPWGRWGLELGSDGEHGGMTSLTMSQISPADRPQGGRINVKVEPSSRIGDGRSGIFVEVNDHYAADGSDTGGSLQLMGFLDRDFDRSIRRSDEIIDHIMSLAERQGE